MIDQQKLLDRMRIRDPSNRRKIVCYLFVLTIELHVDVQQAQLESDLEKAKFKYSQTSQSVEEYMVALERRRIQDLKVNCDYVVYVSCMYYMYYK